MTVNIIGAGFAGVEAAYFLTKKGFKVNLFEMRDKKLTEAHKTAYFAEIVCSNSFKSLEITNAHGLLKKELELLDSIVLKIGFKCKVEAGNSLAVDRELFSKTVTEEIKSLQNLTFFNEEIKKIDEVLSYADFTIIATGPLTTVALQKDIEKLIGKKFLYFFDAAAPIVLADSLDYSKLFFQSRYNKGDADFLNAPLTKEQYEELVKELINAEKITPHDFEDSRLFEGCMPIESLAERGLNTLAFGPLKPVGLIDPKTGRQPYAVVQLRAENINKSMYNLVGFQTRLKWEEQKRIFRKIPGLENAVFLRYGVMHKNFFLNFPEIVDEELYCLKKDKRIYFAGQITGVEGYIESAASGFLVAYAIYARLNNKPVFLPPNTMIGALQRYTVTKNKDYQPMAANFGLLEKEIIKDNKKLKGKEKRLLIAQSSLEELTRWKQCCLEK